MKTRLPFCDTEPAKHGILFHVRIADTEKSIPGKYTLKRPPYSEFISFFEGVQSRFIEYGCSTPGKDIAHGLVGSIGSWKNDDIGLPIRTGHIAMYLRLSP